MKNLRFCLILIWLAAAATAYGGGIAEGRLVNRTDPAIAAGNTELEVLALSNGMDIIKTAMTDARGMFRIEELPDAAHLMLRAIYKGVNYHGMLRFDADGKARLELEVYESTTSMKDIRVESANIAVQLEGDVDGNHLHAVETFVVVNSAKPPRVYVNPEGSFRVSKAPGILEPPRVMITAPGSEMPLAQAALESADGESYYSLYPLRPGGTIFEFHQTLPYTDSKYVYEKKFFHDIPEFPVGVIPLDMTLSGGSLKKTEEHAAENFAVYTAAAAAAGDTAAWTFTGGTPFTAMEHEHEWDETTIIAMDGFVGRNALLIGSTILAIFLITLWFTSNRLSRGSEPEARTPREEP